MGNPPELPPAPAGLPAPIELGRDALGSFDPTSEREWLCTNGIGGFAAGTVSLLNTRRYHGLLFAALRPPVDRIALVAKLDVTVRYGGSSWQLATIESLQKFHHYYGDEFKIECPTGSGNFVSLDDAAREVSARLTRIFLKDEQGSRPAFSQYPRLQQDEHFRDHVLFYEYFHGDTGRGVGAAHQTGWTGLVAKLLQPRRRDK
jgi:hypothetical protein